MRYAGSSTKTIELDPGQDWGRLLKPLTGEWRYAISRKDRRETAYFRAVMNGIEAAQSCGYDSIEDAFRAYYPSLVEQPPAGLLAAPRFPYMCIRPTDIFLDARKERVLGVQTLPPRLGVSWHDWGYAFKHKGVCVGHCAYTYRAMPTIRIDRAFVATKLFRM